MTLIFKPVDVVLNYYAAYKEPQLDQLKEDSRINLARRLLTNFNLRLNDLRYDFNTLSNKLVSFSKFIDPAFFEMSLGLEEVSANLRNPKSVEQVNELFGFFLKLFAEIPIKVQRYTVQQQCSTKGDFGAFLQKLSPYTPDAFHNLITGRGITYNLHLPDHDLAIFITVSDSIIIEKGVFLYFQSEFSPNKYDPNASFKLVKQYYDFILKELDLSASTEV